MIVHNNWKRKQTVHSAIVSLNSVRWYNSDHVVPADGIGTGNGQVQDRGNEFVLTPSHETVAADLPASQKVGVEMESCPLPS